MAEEHVGPHPRWWAWTKIFTGFKVALDPKKLLLAAAGVLVMWIGWAILSWAAFGLASEPKWKNYEGNAKTKEERHAAYTDFKARHDAWNLLYALAGWSSSAIPVVVEPADVAPTLDEYEALTELREEYTRFQEGKITVTVKDNGGELKTGNGTYPFDLVANDAGKTAAALKEMSSERPFMLRDLTPEAAAQFTLPRGQDVFTIKVTQGADDLKKYREEAGDLAQLKKRIEKYDVEKRKTYEAALVTLATKLLPRVPGGLPPEKYGGRLRVSPWTEYRGENPYLLVTNSIKATTAEQPAGKTAAPQASLIAQILDMIPVLLEPLYKVLTPIVYLFHRDADWYVKAYLVLVLLYALAVWAFFGGAISRLAAVQIARNEKIPLREALLFAKDRFVSFFAAPAVPLLILAALVICLWVFGWVEGLIPIFGDILVAGLLWPIVLVVGLIMAVVLVGLIGWPLMNPTIAVEGSDAFDALSRSYSYVYQAIWHYLWYAVVAIAYGMALVFFVGLMASLIVFLGKWGVGMAPFISSTNPANDREPSYLFSYAPTSFGWRDLLIHNSRFAVPVRELTPTGIPAVHYEFPANSKYMQSMSWYNYVGAWLVAIWIGAFFLIVIGFGYSYFWSASTIIYFLMRRQVDDTDMDEVHLEEEESLDPFARPASAAAAPKSDKVSLSVVEPPLRTAISPGAPPATVAPLAAAPPAAPPGPPVASTPPAPEPPMATPPPPAVETPPPAGQDHTEPPPGSP
jgi:hypothetical protein